MDRFETDEIFRQLTGPVEAELEAQREVACREAFKPESRPIPEGLIPHGIPLGHIAIQGDFDTPPSPQV